MPASEGKLFCEITEAYDCAFPKLRKRSRWRTTRSSAGPSSERLSTVTWSSWRSGRKDTVVMVCARSSVMDIESLAGIHRSTSRLPQYLVIAMFDPARAVADCSCMRSLRYAGGAYHRLELPANSRRG